MGDPKLTKQRLETARVIAKGQRIRDVDRLVASYGGTPANWSKRSPRPFRDETGAWIELHWYECHGVGRFEVRAIRPRMHP